MRRTLIAVMLLTIVISSCEDSQIKPSPKQTLDPAVSKFIESKEFSARKLFLEKFGKADFANTIVTYVTEANTSYANLLIPISKGGRVVAQLQVVDLVATRYLPNGEIYAMNLINLAAYNAIDGTGEVKMLDLNYENYEHSVIQFTGNKVVNWRYNSLPENLRMKYANLRKDRSGSKNPKGGVSCDPNKDGNIGFFECTACIKDAIAQSPTSDFICDVPVAGWVGCFTSVTAACIVVSAAY